MKRVLVTGSGGFIGRHAIEPLLERGFEVYLADIRQVSHDPRAVFRQTDLLDPASVRQTVAAVRPSHLLHFAWNVEPGKFWTSLANTEWLRSSVTLLAEFVQNGGRRAVSAGSCAEYDWTGDGFCREATSPVRPATLYGVAKNCARQMQDALLGQVGGESAWGRIFHVYGPHEAESRFVPFLINRLLRGEQAGCSSGEQIRDFMHVGDVARAFVHLLDSSVTGPVNIGTGEPVTLAHVARCISEELNGRDLLRLGALPRPSGDPDRLVPDVSILRSLRFSVTKDLPEGLRDTIAWWKAQLPRP
jgi:nucleoside-diphosphate-sugar epimerase